jgi:site-specific DNA-methyltransferase (adenine-specific)
VRYSDRSGRTVRNDDRDDWLDMAFTELYRVLKGDRFCICFYSWTKVDRFMHAWRSAGFRPVGHLVFVKPYASNQRYTAYHHEQAYVLAKGNPDVPSAPPADVLQWQHTGNRLHPTQKPISVLLPLLAAFAKPGDLVLDPFAGSGSTLVAAHLLQRCGVGIEVDPEHHKTATRRLELLRKRMRNGGRQPFSRRIRADAPAGGDD